MTAETAQPTVLLGVHRELGATLVPFAGFLMPVRYGAIFAEHEAVRRHAGLFDLSHMAQIELTGAKALTFLDSLNTNRMEGLPEGKARYSILTAENGGAIDDIIVYALADRILVVANAANTVAVLAHFRSHAPADVTVTHRSDRALLALQGPKAARILAPLAGDDVSFLGNYTIMASSVAGVPALIARTGYTGEDGFELFVPGDAAPALFRRLLEAGAEHGVLPAGLAARDVLRLEAGMPLYGNELSPQITPLQAGLDWAVRFDKGPFVGRDALYAGRETRSPVIAGLRLRDRIPARAGYRVLDGERETGTVRSATIAPALDGASIATALIEAGSAEIGHTLGIEIRGTIYPATVTAMPFYRRKREPAA